MRPGESGFIVDQAVRRADRMTKRRREVLYHVAFGPMHGSLWRFGLITINRTIHRVYKLHGVDVTAIVLWLARKRLIRLWYRPEQPHPAATVWCLCVTPKGIEELLWPTM